MCLGVNLVFPFGGRTQRPHVPPGRSYWAIYCDVVDMKYLVQVSKCKLHKLCLPDYVCAHVTKRACVFRGKSSLENVIGFVMKEHL